MIELPRAAILAGELAQAAEFFSFGTNDLTQATMGLSRDDAGKFLPAYVETGILPRDPFVSIDQEGVGALVEMAAERGRKARAEAQARRVRRARRRPGEHRVLPGGGPRLRELQPVPRAHRAPRGGAGSTPGLAPGRAQNGGHGTA